jgi:hypothetical protein
LGAAGGGTVFELSPTAGGTWTEILLHGFNFDHISDPGNLTFDAAVTPHRH